jgi:hypothetical protein
MSESNIVDKVVDNKLLLVVQRIGVFVFTILAPIFVGFLIGLDGSLSAVEMRVSKIETRLDIIGPQQDQQLRALEQQIRDLNAKLDAQNEKLITQNTAILQAIARLEAKTEAR